jgi:hypothetical protein
MSDSEYGEDSFCDFEAEACSAAADLCGSGESSSQSSPRCVAAIHHAATAGALLSTASELVQAVLTHCVAAIAQSQLDNTACKAQPCTEIPLSIEDDTPNGSEICALSESDSAQAADSAGTLALQCNSLQNYDALGKSDCDRSSSSSSSSDTATGTLSDRSIASSTNRIVNISDSCAGNTITACSSKQLGSSTTTAVIRSAQPSWTPCYRPASTVPVHGITVKLTQCSAVKRKLASAERQRQQHNSSMLDQSNAAGKQMSSSAAPQRVVNPYVRTRPHWSNMKMSYDEAAWVARRKAALRPQFSERLNSSSSSSFDSSRQQHAKRRPATARPTARYTLQPLQPKLEPRAKSRMHVAIAAARGSSARPATAPVSRIGRLSAHSLLYGAPP